MKHLIRVMLILGSIFAAVFVAGHLLGILTTDNVRSWLEQAQSIDPLWVAGLVVALLFIDLFITVPTLTLTILAGFFLGFPAGASAAFVGVTSAAFGGYCISRRWGDPAIRLILKEEVAREEFAAAFRSNGPVMIMLSRALPMLPEITACMAGVTRMPPLRYAAFFLIGNLPYILVAAYAGSVSSLEAPQPAIYTALVLYGILWTGWYFLRRRRVAAR
ncbi:MAG: VTT domain-containing protein [Minwuia sp.]|nr:VTT domain-containing protein [Minwuia sp.]